MLVALGGLLTRLGDWIWHTGFPLLGEKLAQWGKAFWAWVVPAIGPLLLTLGGMLVRLGGWILTVALPAILSQLGRWAWAFIQWIPGATVSMLKALIPMLGQLGTWIVSVAAPALVVKMMEWSKAFASWIGRAIIEAPGKLLGLLGTIINWARGVAPKILSTLGDLSGLLRDAGMSIVRGLISGIGSMASSVGHALLGLLPGPLQKFANLLGIHSPSKVFADFGANIGQGLIDGIDGSRSGVEASMTGLVSLPRVGAQVIPLLAAGGIVPATPGGRLVRVAKGGRDEAIVPLPKGGGKPGFLGFDYDRMAAAMSRAQIVLDGKNVARSIDQRLAPR
jgi:phage-related protein